MLKFSDLDTGMRRITGRCEAWSANVIVRWQGLDGVLLLIIGILVCVGLLAQQSLSPYVAERINVDEYHFVRKQLIVSAIVLVLATVLALLKIDSLIKVYLGGLVAAVGLTWTAALFGLEIKGAQRWLSLGWITIQPGEFITPLLIVSLPVLFSKLRSIQGLLATAAGVLIPSVIGLGLQPDYPTALLLLAIGLFLVLLEARTRVSVKIFISMLFGGAILSCSSFLALYWLLPNFTVRVDRIFSVTAYDSFQPSKALEAFNVGGIFGVGPADGKVVESLPDVHADFLFAGIAEEYGLVGSLGVIFLFFCLTQRILRTASFVESRVSRAILLGACVYFVWKSVAHFVTNTGILFLGGNSLPFLSYGGSSLMADAFVVSAVLSATNGYCPKAKQSRVGFLVTVLFAIAVSSSIFSKREFRDYVQDSNFVVRKHEEMRERLRVAVAEKTYLTTPARIRQLAEQHLRFEHLSPDQTVQEDAIAQVPYRRQRIRSKRPFEVAFQDDRQREFLTLFLPDFATDRSGNHGFGVWQVDGEFWLTRFSGDGPDVQRFAERLLGDEHIFKGPLFVGEFNTYDGIEDLLTNIAQVKDVAQYVWAAQPVAECCWRLYVRAHDLWITVELDRSHVARGLHRLSDFVVSYSLFEREIESIDLRSHENTYLTLTKRGAVLIGKE